MKIEMIVFLSDLSERGDFENLIIDIFVDSSLVFMRVKNMFFVNFYKILLVDMNMVVVIIGLIISYEISIIELFVLIFEVLCFWN